MALSNIRNEPRREIIEQIAGFVVFALLLWADYAIARLLQNGNDLLANMFLIFCGAVIIFAGTVIMGGAILVLIHVVGEGVCAVLRRVGLDPRPKKRYGPAALQHRNKL